MSAQALHEWIRQSSAISPPRTINEPNNIRMWRRSRTIRSTTGIVTTPNPSPCQGTIPKSAYPSKMVPLVRSGRSLIRIWKTSLNSGCRGSGSWDCRYIQGTPGHPSIDVCEIVAMPTQGSRRDAKCSKTRRPTDQRLYHGFWVRSGFEWRWLTQDFARVIMIQGSRNVLSNE